MLTELFLSERIANVRSRNLVMTLDPDSEQNMSAATKKLISRAKLLVPPMLEKFHKGECRRHSGQSK
jgi:hypothetical protein